MSSSQNIPTGSVRTPPRRALSFALHAAVGTAILLAALTGAHPLSAAGLSSLPPPGTPVLPPSAPQTPNVPLETPQSPARDRKLTLDTTVTLDKQQFDLARENDLKAFVQKVESLRALSSDDSSDDAADSDDTGESGSSKQKQQSAKGGKDWTDKSVRHGLKAMDHIAKELQKGKIDKAAGIHDIQEIAWAIQSNFLTPYTWRKSLDIGDMFFNARGVMLNACGRGRRTDPAANLLTYDAPDLSKVDPKPSTYWTRPASIADKDLYTGYDRQAILDMTDEVCAYRRPHKGYGFHPSFEVKWHNQKWKVKFGEERSSGPLACRIWWALGFPTEVYDYFPELKVRWDRRILSHFNDRQSNAFQLKLLGLPLDTMYDSGYFNPFDHIKYAVLKDGSHVETKQLRQRLFPTAPGQRRSAHPETNPALYDKAFESKIDYLVMTDGSFTSKEVEDAQSVGAWDYNGLDHPRLREVRGMAVLDAWLDNWDIRWGNNQLRLAQDDDGNYRLKHLVSDLGAAFGNSRGIIRTVHGKLKMGMYQNAPNDYGWAFTHPQERRETCVPIQDYMPITKTQPFYELNLDDARWMARLIAQLTETQLKEALIASGFDAAEARLLLEKLVARRDQMIKDFGLSEEIPPLRPQGVNKRFSYDPNTDGPFEVTLPSGSKVAARNSGKYVVINGVLKTRGS